MSGLFLMQLRVDRPHLLRFAADQGLLEHHDEGFGYTMHAWLRALFGEHAPRPYRFLERRGELLAYSGLGKADLLDHAQRFAAPLAFQALCVDSLATKEMPNSWPQGKLLRMEVLACPVTRRDSEEKDVYLHALDRLGDAAPPRPEVYRQWFLRQLGRGVEVLDLRLLGYSRRQLLRRVSAPGGGRRLRTVERPEALFSARVAVREHEGFNRLIARGIGRHRAFGFGMALLSPDG
jgi:CRISPR system Cascade subunit CasE